MNYLMNLFCPPFDESVLPTFIVAHDVVKDTGIWFVGADYFYFDMEHG